jgi:glycine/D-amino acid oxidase-like deaminating enzyme
LLYHLTRLGVGECMLIEKNKLTAGTTWNSAACRTHFSTNSFLGALYTPDDGHLDPAMAAQSFAIGARLAATVVRMPLYVRAESKSPANGIVCAEEFA